jgi:hypothetical protein
MSNIAKRRDDASAEDEEPEDGFLAQIQVLRSRLIALAATHLECRRAQCRPGPETVARMRRMAVALEAAEATRARHLDESGDQDAAELARQSAADARTFVVGLDRFPG